jgi:hypothetical protein
MVSAYERLARRGMRERFIARLNALPPRAPKDEEILFRLADPEALRFFWNWPRPLFELHTWQRRACVLRAWCAQRLGWRRAVDENLRLARRFRRLAEFDRIGGGVQ